MTSKNEQQKIVRVSFEYLLEDGSKKTKFVEGEDAEKWNEMMKTVCVLADIHGQPQAWSNLDWREMIESN